MRFTVAGVAILLVTGALSVAIPDNHVVHEEKRSTRGWKRSTKLEDDVSFPVRIGLTQSNLHLGYELLMDV
jgi:tripeptidyl-peptidase-1